METRNVKTIDLAGSIRTFELPALQWVLAGELESDEFQSERVKSLWIGAFIVLPISRQLVQILDIR